MLLEVTTAAGNPVPGFWQCINSDGTLGPGNGGKDDATCAAG